MQMLAEIAVDSYPVGLDISNDGRYVLVTSQGRKNGGGNAVNIYQIDYPEPEPVKKEPVPADSDSIAAPAADNGSSISQSSIMKWLSTTTGQVTAGAIAAVLIAAVAVPVSMKRRRK